MTSEMTCGCLEREHCKNQSFWIFNSSKYDIRIQCWMKRDIRGKLCDIREFHRRCQAIYNYGHTYNCMYMQMYLKQKKCYLVKSLPSKYQL